jgi:hypothetical protein
MKLTALESRVSCIGSSYKARVPLSFAPPC